MNNISGTVTISSGGIIVNSGASLCGPTCSLVVNGGTLTLSNAAQTIGTLNGTGGTIDLAAGNTLTSAAGASASYSGAITGSGNFTYSPTISTYIQTLDGACTYSGNTTITASGTLALGVGGSINNTATISFAPGTTLDVSTQASPYNLSTNTTLIATATNFLSGASGGTIKGPAGGIVNLGSQPITLNMEGSGVEPAIYISQGTLSLNGNPFTVNTPSPLTNGTYSIVHQTTGSVASSGTCTVTGTAIGPGNVGYIQVSGENVNLVVTNLQPANITNVTTLGNGTMQLSLAGTPGQNYSVQATTNLDAPISWLTLGTNLSDSNGLFQFTDTNSTTNFKARFYRSTTP
jgi:hypothetical protein